MTMWLEYPSFKIDRKPKAPEPQNQGCQGRYGDQKTLGPDDRDFFTLPLDSSSDKS
jgi:hypothetical protein